MRMSLRLRGKSRRSKVLARTRNGSKKSGAFGGVWLIRIYIYSEHIYTYIHNGWRLSRRRLDWAVDGPAQSFTVSRPLNGSPRSARRDRALVSCSQRLFPPQGEKVTANNPQSERNENRVPDDPQVSLIVQKYLRPEEKLASSGKIRDTSSRRPKARPHNVKSAFSFPSLIPPLRTPGSDNFHHLIMRLIKDSLSLGNVAGDPRKTKLFLIESYELADENNMCLFFPSYWSISSRRDSPCLPIFPRFLSTPKRNACVVS